MDEYWLGSDKGKEKLDAELDDYWANKGKDDEEEAAGGEEAGDGEADAEGDAEEIQE